jgi:hypothetical protein
LAKECRAAVLTEEVGGILFHGFDQEISRRFDFGDLLDLNTDLSFDS